MKLDARCIHYSAKPLKLGDLHDGNQKYTTDEEAKPDGLWFSVGDGADWVALVEARFKPHQIRHQTEVFFVEKPTSCVSKTLTASTH
jgi:hypothetical protein